MKIKSVVAVGAMGVGLGLAGLVGGTATASAACNETTPPLSIPRVECVTNANIATFQDSINPANQLNTFLNGTDTTEGGVTTNDGLGVLDQPATFVNSIVGPGGFLDGPREP
jgi:hypothetical protein